MNMMSEHPDQMPEDRGEDAERWFVRMQRGDCTREERLACRRWQAASPANAAAYARVEALYRASADFGLDPGYRASARMARERAERAGRRRRRVRRWGASLSAAAVLVLAVGVGWRVWDPAQPEQRHATAVGERRTLTLDDGSRVQLDTDTALTVRYGRMHRDIVLEQGRAQFAVASAPRRPFVVRAGDGSVRAVGTEFQVRRHDASVLVTLLEGVVEVSTQVAGRGAPARSATLAPGEQLSLGADGLWSRDAVDAEAAQGWTRGELIFRQRPLHELLEEANRYTAVKIRIGDPALNDLRVSGVFESDDQASLLQAIEHVLSLRAEQVSPYEIVLHRQ